MTDLEVTINKILTSHRVASGMKVAMGRECTCGYWSGAEHPGTSRPMGFSGDGLNWHRAKVIAAFIEDRETNVKQ